jgi:CHASE2 domain-containing sensor protein
MKSFNATQLKFLQNKILAAGLIAVIVTALSATLLATGIFHSWHLKIADTLYPRNEPSKDIVIIAIDDKSTDPLNLGRFSAWSREYYAKLLDALQRENPKAILFDIFFVNPSRGIPQENLYEISKSVKSAQTSKEKLDLYESSVEPYNNLFKHPSDELFGQALAKFNNIILGTNISEEA